MKQEKERKLNDVHITDSEKETIKQKLREYVTKHPIKKHGKDDT